jgi:predicted outer membrane repeat protein
MRRSLLVLVVAAACGGAPSRQQPDAHEADARIVLDAEIADVSSSRPDASSTGDAALDATTGVPDADTTPDAGPTACVFFVDENATGAGTGATWTDAFTTLQPALAAASAGCDVWVAQGTYYALVSGALDSFSIGDGVQVHGGFAGGETDRSLADPALHPTVLDGGKYAGSSLEVDHVVLVAGASGIVLDGFTITHGAATGSSTVEDSHGGGILFDGFDAPASGTITRCEIAGNSAQYGGGVASLFNGVVTLDHVWVHDDTATLRGGGLECGGTRCLVTSSAFTANTAALAGGAIDAPSTLQLGSDTFASNHSDGDGGAISLVEASGTSLVDVGFLENTAAGSGGALLTTGTGPTVMENEVFVGNLAATGGAIADQETNGLVLINVTLIRNGATTAADALSWSGGVPFIRNTIIWGNPEVSRGADVDPPTWTAITTDHSDLRSYVGPDTNTFDADPELVSLPRFFDAVTATSSGTADVLVADAARYQIGDVLEIGGDGVARTVSSTSPGDVFFSPALAAPAATWTVVRIWGSGIATLDAHLADGSPCIDAGNDGVAPTYDLDGNARVGTSDVGAYEHP